MSHDLTVPQADTYTTVDNYDPMVKAAVYEKFMTSSYSIDDLAVLHSVSSAIIEQWASDGKWMERKKRMTEQVMARADDALARYAVTQRERIIREQLERSQKIHAVLDTKIQEMTDNPNMDPRELRSNLRLVSEVFSVTANIEARAVGVLGDRLICDAKVSAAQQESKTPVAVVLNMNGNNPSEVNVTQG